jgi:uncharacterized protein (DUF362 family)/NAD-dependent dihydropyrimidine dehydrogenase PreA subunit
MTLSNAKVSLVKCVSYGPDAVQAAVKQAVDFLGGMQEFIKPKERILLKPNLLTDATPEQCVTTHPEVLRAVIRLIKPVTSYIYCGDAPNVWGEEVDVDRVYEASGVKRVCQEEGVELCYFTHPKMVGGYPLTDWLNKCDKLVSIPKFKTHGLTLMSAAVKNLFGLVVGMSKTKIHIENPRSEELSRVLVDICAARRPDLTIVDGIEALEGEGPGTSGTPKKVDLVAASADAFALDMILAKIMGLNLRDVATIRISQDRGLAPKDCDVVVSLGEPVESFLGKNFQLPKTTPLNKMPKALADLMKYILVMKVRVAASRCKVCGQCLKICPACAISLESGRLLINDKKCIRCLCCQEICPKGAIEVRRNLLWQILSRG